MRIIKRKHVPCPPVELWFPKSRHKFPQCFLCTKPLISPDNLSSEVDWQLWGRAWRWDAGAAWRGWEKSSEPPATYRSILLYFRAALRYLCKSWLAEVIRELYRCHSGDMLHTLGSSSPGEASYNRISDNIWPIFKSIRSDILSDPTPFSVWYSNSRFYQDICNTLIKPFLPYWKIMNCQTSGPCKTKVW